MPPRVERPRGTDAGMAAELDELEAAGADIGMPAGLMRRLGRRGGFSPHAVRLTVAEALATLGEPK